MPESLIREKKETKYGVAGGECSQNRERHRDAHAPRTSPLTKAAVAELSMSDVRRMSCEELAAAIRTADVPLFQKNVLRQLSFYDRPTLEQLLFLARRTVRNQGY